MIIEYSETDESHVRWNSGGEWKSADIEELIEAYEWKQSIPRHGRLIDADRLYEEMWNAKMEPSIGGAYQTGFCDARAMLVLSPTVIEADRSE